MDLPKPPDEPELKNIIDKLANFVARNGHEFEQMTKQKQKNNNKFSFLFGGEHFNYYQFRVVTEQAVLNQQKQKAAAAQQQLMAPDPPGQRSGMPVSRMSSLSMQSGPPLTPQQLQQIDQLDEQLEQMYKSNEEQLKQSESNLAAQYQSLMQQRQRQIEEAIAITQEEEIVTLSTECNISLEEFNMVLKPITESCTKDAISSGKNWIFLHNLSEKHAKLIALYMKKKIIAPVATFEQRLFLIYLINDVLHHCMRKNAEDLRKAFETVVTHIFCMAHLGASDDNQHKLLKLLNLWDQNKYFSATIIQDLREPGMQTMSNYHSRLSDQYQSVSNQISQAINARYTSLQQQHQEFVNHLDLQAKALEQQIQQLRQPSQVEPQGTGAPPTGPPLAGSNIPIPSFPPPNFNQPPPNFSQPPPSLAPPAQFEYSHGQAPPVVQEYNHGQNISAPPPTSMGSTPAVSATTTPATAGPPIPLPDLSKPPPGFPPLPGAGPPLVPPGLPPPGMPPVPPMSAPSTAITDADLMPSVPYYELPAGLMAPLVKLEDCSYRSLDPKDIRLPPPMPPSERLLAAVEAFYSPPSHERPRDGEGWEKLGLFEFFKAKDKAKKLKELERRDHRSGSTSSSRSSSSSSRSSDSRSRSRSYSPKRRSRSRSYSRSPIQRSKRSRSRSRSTSRGRRSAERSPSPPAFSAPFYATNTNTSLGDENKGRQLLKKMGWGGGGLGSSEQGIVNPVEHAEVREKVDMFKGLGMANNDPFEQFRKNKSQGFIQRMKERDPAAT